MTTTDWIIDIALILMVVRQLREAPMDRRFWLIPAALVGFTVHTYLRAIPTAGNDLVLIGGLVALGAALGLAGALTTRVRAEAGRAYVRAGVSAASLWVGSMTARLAFIVWISHGGQDALARFSAHHDITTGTAWQDGLVLMALAEVAVRIGLLVLRGHRAAAASRPSAPQLLTV